MRDLYTSTTRTGRQGLWTLPAHHYAAGWKTEGGIKTLAEIDELGRRYAEGRDKDALLELCRAFHPYLMKYLVLICRGHLPIYAQNQHGYRINRDVEQFVRYFLPRGEMITPASMAKVARHFHLAFKEKDAGEIYDIFMELFIAAANKYDPNYTGKVKRGCRGN